jgi:hypothetical protein
MKSDDLIAEAERLIQNPKASPTARVRAMELIARMRHRVGEAEPVWPDGPPLTVKERSALRDALIWPESGLWDEEQRAVVVKLGLWSESELAKEIERTQPRRTRRR